MHPCRATRLPGGVVDMHPCRATWLLRGVGACLVYFAYRAFVPVKPEGYTSAMKLVVISPATNFGCVMMSLKIGML